MTPKRTHTYTLARATHSNKDEYFLLILGFLFRMYSCAICHTARLIQALVDEGKAYDLLCFPNERHSPRSEKDRAFMEARVFAFLDTWLRQ